MKTPPAYELYDLRTDPHEYRNLADQADHAEVLASLKERLAEWRRRTRDPLLKPENLKRLKAEVEACIDGDRAYKERLHLSYTDYFF